MNGLVTLEIPVSELIQFITTGLSANDVPPPIVPRTSGGGLPLDFPVEVVTNQNAPYTGNAIAVPSGTTRITWSTYGISVSDIALQGSLDGVHFANIDTMSAFGAQTVVSGTCFLRVVITTGTGVSVTITAKREKL